MAEDFPRIISERIERVVTKEILNPDFEICYKEPDLGIKPGDCKNCPFPYKQRCGAGETIVVEERTVFKQEG